MFDIAIERLRRIPIRRSDEVWEVAAMPLPRLVRDGDKPGDMYQIAACACVSSCGGAMISEMQRVDAFEMGAPLEAIARFASDPHRADVLPLGYLPGRVVIGPMPETAQEYVASALASLGIEVECTDEYGLSRDFMAGLIQQITQEELGEAPPIHAMAGIMRRKGMTVERVRAFAEAARAFWRAKPWTCCEGETIWSIEPRPKAKEMRHVSIMGGGGQEFGLAFLDSPDRVRRMMESEDPRAYFESMNMTHWSVGFEYRDDAPLSDLWLWEEEQLPLAGDDAFPLPMGITRTGRVSRPTPDTLALMEGLLRVFAGASRRDLCGDLIARTVKTFDGDVCFYLQAALRT
ncbi:MAG: hypothetical protein KF912_09905 [Phycisphaeraceae bacterium]|nr:hypothetical protein [Phycisphaeraceae bacterium]QYK47710.1 MAG: hypothetical protein KF838_13065 [Phycisphaeraceae bacterium]